jgi:hypothetical protein
MLVFIEFCMQIYKNIHYYNSDDMIILCFCMKVKGMTVKAVLKTVLLVLSFVPFTLTA